jgi:tetratricopeptide (TPR) repeat protein
MKVREVLGFLVGAWLLAGGQFVARAQELGSPSASKSTKSTIVSSLEKIQKDFVQHVEKEKQMQDKYRELESKLKKTEDELQRVNAQGMQQQLAAMQTAMQSMQLNANLRLLATGNAGGNSGNNGNNNNTMVRDFAQMQLMQNRFLQNLDATMRADEMRQLDANAQAIVRSRIETIQAAVQLQQSWGQWQNESISFYTRYWPVSDPEGRWSPGERDAALETLEKRHENDIAAKLATANVLANATRHAEALKLVEEIVELPTQLQGVAMMEKAKILTLLDKDKEAKQALQAALKLDKDNPHLRWIRAEVAREQGQDSIAESELRFLSTIKSMEYKPVDRWRCCMRSVPRRRRGMEAGRSRKPSRRWISRRFPTGILTMSWPLRMRRDASRNPRWIGRHGGIDGRRRGQGALPKTQGDVGGGQALSGGRWLRRLDPFQQRLVGEARCRCVFGFRFSDRAGRQG